MLDLAIQIAQNHYEKYKKAYPYASEMIYKIIEDYGIAIDEFSMNDNFAGMLWSDNGRYTIVINPEMPKPRKLFTLAHELGHFVLHRWYQPSFFCTRLKGQAFDAKERQANVFAAELLMPIEKIKAHATAGATIIQVARCMGVSAQALRYRVKELKQRQEMKIIN